MKLYSTQFGAMGCNNQIVAFAAAEATAHRAMDAARIEVVRIQNKYSRYSTDSIVSQINAAAGRDKSVACDTETSWLLDCANTLYRESDGVFDATSGVLRRAWNFASQRLPTQAELDPLLALVDWEKVERTERSVRLAQTGMEIDFGGFGKEYACDRAAGVMADLGIAHGFVNLGGDIRAIGPDAAGNPWIIGVQNPRQSGVPVAKIALANGGLATSSDSEKYIEIEGRRYCHILNPKTGQPVNCWASVSVQAPTALQAGCLTTIAMLKERAARAFLSKSKCPALFVDLDGQIFSPDQPLSMETAQCQPQL